LHSLSQHHYTRRSSPERYGERYGARYEAKRGANFLERAY
jgi:hypothetical protein